MVEQKERVETQESEMIAKKKELEDLRSEEANLQSKLAAYKKEVDKLSQTMGQIQLQTSQTKATLVTLEEYKRQLTEGMSELKTAVGNKDYHKLNSLLIRPISPPPELMPVCLF